MTTERACIAVLQEGLGCRRCVESDPVCLKFHHPDSEPKTAAVGTLISDSAPESEVRGEARRCVVLCANCHRKEHVEPRGETGMGQ